MDRPNICSGRFRLAKRCSLASEIPARLTVFELNETDLLPGGGRMLGNEVILSSTLANLDNATGERICGVSRYGGRFFLLSRLGRDRKEIDAPCILRLNSSLTHSNFGQSRAERSPLISVNTRELRESFVISHKNKKRFSPESLRGRLDPAAISASGHHRLKSELNKFDHWSGSWFTIVTNASNSKFRGAVSKSNPTSAKSRR